MAGLCSILNLVIQKGPRQGETLEFSPGSIIRLGRVVRGNSVTIKDSGISTKHLQFEFDKHSGKWVITDLGSSNGTLLNHTHLVANTPFFLSNNDVVKLGEFTVIAVNIICGLGGNVVDKSKPGRKRKIDNVVCDEVNQGRKLRSRVTTSTIREEGVEDDFGKQLERLAAIERKGRGKKKLVQEDLVKDLAPVVLDQDVQKSTINEFQDVLESEGCGVENGDVDIGVDLDLECMTLGEWIDFLEVYLPKKIHDETEELISSMNKRAKQFHGYTVQQKSAMRKGKSLMVYM